MAGHKAWAACLQIVCALLALCEALDRAAAEVEHMSKLPASTRSGDITTIHFFQDFQDRSCTTAFGPSPVSGSVLEFGQGRVFDYPVTASAEPGSLPIGRARGIHIYESLDADGVHEVLTISFNSGEFARSSFTMGGHGPADALLHELPVVGGTGVFRFARGSAIYQQALPCQSDTIYSVEVSLKDVEWPRSSSS